MAIEPPRRFLRELSANVKTALVALIVAELILRAIDLRFLKEGHQQGYTVVHRYDPELGWLPVPNSVSIFIGSRTIHVQHNSLGLRDIEPDPTPKPTILFLGDSKVWGYDVEARDRFTELLRPEMPSVKLVNAGVSGYGTDQEYLLLKRLWNTFEPSVVVLIFSVDTDRADNTSNSRYDGYLKPYLEHMPGGEWQFRGQPVPKSRHVYFTDNWLVHNLWVARVAVSAYVQLRSPGITVPDPTEHLVAMMREFVEQRGARFLVGLQYHDAQLEAFLQAQGVPHTSFEGAESYLVDGNHWTPKGHALVADRLRSLLSRTGMLPSPGTGR